MSDVTSKDVAPEGAPEISTQKPLAQKRAVALKYEAPEAPVVVAKGDGVLAEKIIEAAQEHGIYIRENPVLAEALGAVELDEEIPVELYRAVAEIIGFVLSLQKGQSHLSEAE